MTNIFTLAQVEEWIDGATIQTKTEEDGTKTGFAWNLYDQTFKLFTILLPLVFINHSSKQFQSYQKSLKDSMGKLFLWGDGYRNGRLETILDKSDDLNETVLETLVAIGHTLISSLFSAYQTASPKDKNKHSELFCQVQQLKILLEKAENIFNIDQDGDESNLSDGSDENSIESNDSFLAPVSKAAISLKIYTACLMDLLPSMENTLNYADFETRSAQSTPPVKFEISGPAQPYVLNVLDRFSKANARLVERLGEANWQRHTALRSFDPSSIQNVYSTEDVVSETQDVPKSIFVPVSLFHDSGLGSSLPTQSSYSMSVASHSSFMSSLGDGENAGLRVPSTPKEVFEGKPFICQICRHALNRIKNRIDWKRHVFADLKPYICTYSGCDDELLMFPTRKLWEIHEFTKHRIDYTWACSKCPEQFSLVQGWRTHLTEKHGIEFTESQFHHAAKIAENVLHHPRYIQECPLCLCTLGKSRREFVTHVGKHMESIALAALPRESNSDSDESSVATNANSVQNETQNRSSEFIFPRMQEPAKLDSTNLDNEVVDSTEARLGEYADEIIRSKWDNGKKISFETAPIFAANTLLYVRIRFDEEYEPLLDPYKGIWRLSLKDMRWVFETKIKPFTSLHRFELFICNGCEDTRHCGFLDLIQHHAVKHGANFSNGSREVDWDSEWPDDPPFSCSPAASSTYELTETSAPVETTVAKVVTKEIPLFKSHTTNQLAPEGDEYISWQFDEVGERKVATNGQLQDGRKYRCMTFFIPSRGSKFFMLAAECARVLDYRDVDELFAKNETLFQIIATKAEEEYLINSQILPYLPVSKTVALVTARSVFRQFGSRIVVNGKRVRDDYWEMNARRQGFTDTEEDLVRDKKYGTEQATDAITITGKPTYSDAYGDASANLQPSPANFDPQSTKASIDAPSTDSYKEMKIP